MILYTLHIHIAAVVTAGTLHIALVTPGCRLYGCFIVEDISDMVSPFGKEPIV